MRYKLNKFFNRSEFACKCGCDFKTVDVELLGVLTITRMFFGKPLVITSACRCISHNSLVGGSPNSYHLRACAADHYVHGVSSPELYDYYQKKHTGRYGLYCVSENVVHLDLRGSAWRQPPRMVNYAIDGGGQL